MNKIPNNIRVQVLYEANIKKPTRISKLTKIPLRTTQRMTSKLDKGLSLERKSGSGGHNKIKPSIKKRVISKTKNIKTTISPKKKWRNKEKMSQLFIGLNVKGQKVMRYFLKDQQNCQLEIVGQRGIGGNGLVRLIRDEGKKSKTEEKTKIQKNNPNTREKQSKPQIKKNLEWYQPKTKKKNKRHQNELKYKVFTSKPNKITRIQMDLGKNNEENVQTGLNAQRNIPPSSTIFEEESKNKLSQTRYQEKYPQYEDDYYKSGSINYKGYEYNQNRTIQEKQKNEFENNINNFKEIQNINTQTTQQEQTNANYQKKNNFKQEEIKENGEMKDHIAEIQTQALTTQEIQDQTADTEEIKINKRNNQNQRQYNNRNQYNRNQRQNNTNIPKRNQQRQDYEKQSITKQMLQEQEIQQEQTCKYWKNGTCRNYECQRKHYEMIKIMNMHYKPKSKRIKNNVIDQNALQKEIEKQELNVIIETTRQMNINEIQQYIAKKSQKLEQKEISNIKIKIAVKNNKKIKQEIQDIKNIFLVEYEKNKDTINLTQAELISTNEILNQIKKEEFNNIRQAFAEYNKEQEYENEKFREKLSNIIEKLREEKNQKNKEMEVEDNNVRISQTINTYKPNIQDYQFKNIQFGQQIQQSINIGWPKQNARTYSTPKRIIYKDRFLNPLNFKRPPIYKQIERCLFYIFQFLVLFVGSVNH
ncbi:hypothetical protein ABPG72_020131 [Tetrahymena utriculariae]